METKSEICNNSYNSLKAFQELKDSGLLGKRQLEVYRAILENPNKTDRELSEILGEEDSNYERPRRRDLVKLGLIEKSGDRLCSISHKTASIWKKKNYDLNALLKKKEEENKRDSKYYMSKWKELEQKVKGVQEKYFEELRKEQKQTNLYEFKR